MNWFKKLFTSKAELERIEREKYKDHLDRQKQINAIATEVKKRNLEPKRQKPVPPSNRVLREGDQPMSYEYHQNRSSNDMLMHTMLYSALHNNDNHHIDKDNLKNEDHYSHSHSSTHHDESANDYNSYSHSSHHDDSSSSSSFDSDSSSSSYDSDSSSFDSGSFDSGSSDF